MTLEVTYSRTGLRGGGTGVVTEETSEVEFDEQGRARFRASPSGEIRRVDPVHVLSIEESSWGGL